MLKGSIFKVARVAIFVYFGLGIVLLVSERSTVYLPDYPEPSVFGDCMAFGPEAENIVFEGVRIHHKRVSASGEGHRIVVLYHGNAGSACDRALLAPVFERADYSYAFVEYPGYAGDTGGPSKERILASVPVVQSFLEAQGYVEVVLAGESLGVGVAAYHASHANPSALILISPYYELADLAGWIGSLYPVGLLMRENYTPGEWLAGIAVPTLLIEAAEDEMVPPASAERLYASLSGEKVSVRIPGGHNELYNHPEFYESIERFLSGSDTI